jgi:hypothetical protein
MEKDLRESFISTRNLMIDFRKENINLAGISSDQKLSHPIGPISNTTILETLLRGIFLPSIQTHPIFRIFFHYVLLQLFHLN